MQDWKPIRVKKLHPSTQEAKPAELPAAMDSQTLDAADFAKDLERELENSQVSEIIPATQEVPEIIPATQVRMDDPIFSEPAIAPQTSSEDVSQDVGRGTATSKDPKL